MLSKVDAARFLGVTLLLVLFAAGAALAAARQGGGIGPPTKAGSIRPGGATSP